MGWRGGQNMAEGRIILESTSTVKILNAISDKFVVV